MASALAAEMVTRTNVNCAWLDRFSPSTLDSASAADAPQIATDPPASTPKPEPSRSAFAASAPVAVTSATIAAIQAKLAQPRSMICHTVT